MVITNDVGHHFDWRHLHFGGQIMYNEIRNDINGLMQKARLIDIYRVLDLVGFVFELPGKKKLKIHTQCYIRIFDSDNTLAICTQNMFSPNPEYKKKKFKWTKVGTTLFDYAINEYRDKLYSTEVVSATFDNKDLIIRFANNMYLEILTITTKYDDLEYYEDYRIFGEDRTEEHYIV